jgi:hypothetical protein
MVACSRGDPAAAANPAPARTGRFGSLRDFVLLAVPGPGEPGPSRFVFLDRFEVTRGDWSGFAATPEGQAVGAEAAVQLGDPALPVGRVDLRQARAFARWRLARLPSAAEWAAAVGDGRTRFPWGNRVDPARANTGDLGLLEPLPVGTFESGRRGIGWPYDLVGNVSEWTESVPAAWWTERWPTGDGVGDVPGIDAESARRRVLAAPGLALWQVLPGQVPSVWPVAAGGEQVPREVVGSDFQSPMTQSVETVLAGDQRLRLGLRLAVAPGELVRQLVAYAGEVTGDDLEQVRRFLARSGHPTVLRAAWRAELGTAGPLPVGRPLVRLLLDTLGPPGGP